MIAARGAHYELFNGKTLTQTSFELGDVEKRAAQIELGLEPNTRLSARGGLVLPDERPGNLLPSMPELREAAQQFGKSIYDVAAEFWPRIGGSAEIAPDEGLDLLLGQQPLNSQAIVAPTFLGLFTSQSATTVPARTAVMATQTGVTEVPNAAAYARVSTANTDWAAIATNGAGRRTTSAQKSFPESTASWGTVMGFFDATIATVLLGKAFFYANFDDAQSVGVNASGYTLRITPYWQLDG